MRRGKLLTQKIRLYDWAQGERFRELAQTILGARVTVQDWSDGFAEVHTGRLTPGQVEVLRRLSERRQVELTWNDYRREVDQAREETESLLEDLNRLSIAYLTQETQTP